VALLVNATNAATAPNTNTTATQMPAIAPVLNPCTLALKSNEKFFKKNKLLTLSQVQCFLLTQWHLRLEDKGFQTFQLPETKR
jgi:hypothetical protein